MNTAEKVAPVVVYENPWFQIVKNGKFHYMEPVKYRRAVATVPVFENGDLLMVRLPRVPAIGLSLEFPRGGVEGDEPFEDAAARELREETGYDVSPARTRHLGRIGGDTGLMNFTAEVYSVDIPDSAVQGSFDTEEIDVPIRVTRAQFIELVRNGQIVDGATLASWTLYITQ